MSGRSRRETRQKSQSSLLGINVKKSFDLPVDEVFLGSKRVKMELKVTHYGFSEIVCNSSPSTSSLCPTCENEASSSSSSSFLPLNYLYFSWRNRFHNGGKENMCFSLRVSVLSHALFKDPHHFTCPQLLFKRIYIEMLLSRRGSLGLMS